MPESNTTTLGSVEITAVFERGAVAAIRKRTGW